MNSSPDTDRFIRIIASLSSPRQFENPQLQEADGIEIRLDMITEPIGDLIKELRNRYTCPIILTARSSDEGGAFAGNSMDYQEKITPFISHADYVDLEGRFRDIAPWVKEQGVKVIASCHRNEMLSPSELKNLYDELVSFGDIPKIAVQPQNHTELLQLLEFTESAIKPVIVSVTGDVCRYARPLLAIFGSLFTYCYLDSPTSSGQYSLREMQILTRLLSPGRIDTWYEGRPVRSGDASGFYSRMLRM